jgi:hypothetical protein
VLSLHARNLSTYASSYQVGNGSTNLLVLPRPLYVDSEVIKHGTDNEYKLEVGIARCNRFNQFSKTTRAFIGGDHRPYKDRCAEQGQDERRLKQLQLCGRMCRQPPSVLYFQFLFFILDLAHVNDCGNL